MTRTDKPRVAFFSFTGCEGDQLQVINLEERLLDLVDVVDIVSFREATSEHSDDYDIAFVEGAASTPHDAERLEGIRDNADLVIALGSCAALGGIPSLRNDRDFEEVRRYVYGDDADTFEAWSQAKPVEEVIDVDYEIPGCPIDREEFIQTVQALVVGAQPTVPSHPVCLECKFEEHTCAFARGETCLGPITRGGCGASCVGEGARCWGCRGMVDNPARNAHTRVLEEYGVSREEIIEEYQLYWNWQLMDAETDTTEVPQ